jgi:hypothetical protein
MEKMRHVVTIPKIEDEKWAWWRRWIQLWYIVTTFVNVTMYPKYNNNIIKKEVNLKQLNISTHSIKTRE